MDIATVIKSLLYRHNCVIIPGFGGLVTEYAPAQVHPIQNIFLPPHKSIAFNRNLNSNDGLLIAEMAREENTTYDKAGLQLQQFVRLMESGLKNKGSFLLPSIGKFYFDVENNLQFKEEEHKNFLLPAFGLDQFIAHPVMRREEVMAALEHSIVVPKKKRRTRALAFGVLLAVMVIAVQIFTVNTDFSGFQETGFYRFVSSVFTSHKNSVPTAEQNAPHRKDTLINIFIIQNSTPAPVDTSALIANSTQKDSVQMPVTMTALPVQQVNETPVTDGKYFVIFGCFKGKTNSEVLIEQLKAKGITTSIVKEDSYRRVGIGGFQTFDDAVLQMHTYHQQGYADVWVMKN